MLPLHHGTNRSENRQEQLRYFNEFLIGFLTLTPQSTPLQSLDVEPLTLQHLDDVRQCLDQLDKLLHLQVDPALARLQHAVGIVVVADGHKRHLLELLHSDAPLCRQLR
jgi:hypothetical protein